MKLNFRTGTGFDVHAFAKGRKLILGGIEIPSEIGLEGHSDADVLVHAVCDALLGAAGLGTDSLKNSLFLALRYSLTSSTD